MLYKKVVSLYCKTFAQIATERNLTVSTIEGHLAHFIIEGKLLATELISENKLKLIIQHFQKFPDMPNKDRKLALGDDVSYADLKVATNHLIFIKSC